MIHNILLVVHVFHTMMCLCNLDYMHTSVIMNDG